METDGDKCRFCYDGDQNEEFIVPCKCDGSNRFIHRSCLDTWRASDVSGAKFRTCGTCHFDFVLDADESLSDENKNKKFIFQTSVDIIFWLFAVTLSIVFGVIILRFIDHWRIIPLIFFFGWNELSYAVFIIMLYGLIWCLVNKDFNTILINSAAFGSVGGIMVTGLSYAIAKSHQNILKTMDDNHKKIFLKEQTGLYRVHDFKDYPPEELPWRQTIEV